MEKSIIREDALHQEWGFDLSCWETQVEKPPEFFCFIRPEKPEKNDAQNSRSEV